MGYYSKGTWAACPIIGGPEHSVIWLTEDEPLKSITDNVGEERWFDSEEQAEIYAAGMNAPELLLKMIKQHEGCFDSVIDEARAVAMVQPLTNHLINLLASMEQRSLNQVRDAAYTRTMQELKSINDSIVPRTIAAITHAEFSIHHGITLNCGIPFNKEAGAVLLNERIGIAILDLQTMLGDEVFAQLINNQELEMEFCLLVDMMYDMGLTRFSKLGKMITELRKVIPSGGNGSWHIVAIEAKDSKWWRENSKVRQRIPQMFHTGEWVETEEEQIARE